MEERELIAQLKKARAVKPGDGFVLETRTRIFDRTSENVLYTLVSRIGHFGNFLRGGNFRFAYAAVVSVFAVVLLSSVFFSVDRTSPEENGQEVLVQQEEGMSLAELEEMTEYEEAVRDIDTTKRAIADRIKEQPEEEARQLAAQVGQLFREADRAKEELGRAYGVSSFQEEEDEEDPDKVIAEYLIRELEESSLTESQQELLEEAKGYLEDGAYGLALEAALSATGSR